MRKFVKFLTGILSFICLVSCAKDKASDPTPEPTPDPEVTEVSVDLLIAVAPNQSDFIKRSLEISVGEKTVTINPEEMTEVTSTSGFPDFKAKVEALTKNHSTPKYYSISLGKISKGQTVKGTKCTATPVASRPEVEEFDFYHCHTLLINSKEGALVSYQTACHFGIENTDESVNLKCKLLNKDFLLDYTY